MRGEVDGLGRLTPGTVRFALIFENETLTMAPRDQATLEWLKGQSGRLHCDSALRKLSEHWLHMGVSRRDCLFMAVELQGLISDRYRSHAEGHQWYHPGLTIEVRACEYVASPLGIELREIR